MANIIKAKRSAVPGKVPATTDLALGEIGINTYDGKAYIKKDVGGVESIVALGGGAGTGDVTGPASSTDNAVSRFDGASGKTIQNSTVTLDDNGNFANVNAVSFDTTPGTLPTAAGSMFWDDGNGTPSIILSPDVTLQLGQEQLALVYNGTGSTIQNGKVVAVVGAQGQRPSVALADADSEALSAPTLGITTQDIANGAEGFVTTFGFVRGLNTSAFTAGDPIYLSQTAGGFTATRPAAPAHTVALGWVIKVNASSGEIFVNINNGWELDELHNVLISSVANNEALIYNSAQGVWKNTALKTINSTTLVGSGNISVGDVAGPSSATDNAITRFDGTTGKLVQNSSATVDDSGNIAALSIRSSGTSADKMSVGTTAQRPGTPATGEYRLNSTFGFPEWYDTVNSQWLPFFSNPNNYQIEYLVVAGGGGGGCGVSGNFYGGGGGAGGLLTGFLTVAEGAASTVTIGAGGSYTNSTNAAGGQGGNSVFGSITALGGGYGSSGGISGGNGGSGGGAHLNGGPGSGTSGQGFRGGNYLTGGQGAPGGGATAAGPDNTTAANNGYTVNFDGTSKTYATGGDGNPGGSGGGANTGNGGKGGFPSQPGNAGGTGVVLVRYLGPQRATGGTVTTSGGYTIHTFTTAGTFTA